GHRRVAFLGGRADLESARLREQGYRTALARAGIPVDPGLVANGGYRRGTARTPATVLLTGPDRPTAIFAANDLSALGVMDAAADLGLAIPGDLSVVGFDNVPESALTTPPLTTVDQPIQQMGSEATSLLIRLLEGRTGETTHVRLPTVLVERGSTRAL
ncbi:MAG TPA: substrate-binding domain-containing protein, partial [Actinotalea sp.]|nr:substrate-binding domain-containing protein [Actinotalea sp.]